MFSCYGGEILDYQSLPLQMLILKAAHLLWRKLTTLYKEDETYGL